MKTATKDRELRLNDSVILVSEAFGCSRYNPVWGKYESNVIGKVVQIKADNFTYLPVTVKWDNLVVNQYNLDNLKLHPGEWNEGGNE